MSEVIVQSVLPKDVPWRDPQALRLPGLSPLSAEEWLLRDDAFAAQMALRDRLIAKQHADVIAVEPSALPAAQESLDMVLAALDRGYSKTTDGVLRPDVVSVAVDRTDPMGTIGRLIQSDFCLLENGPDGHVLTAAALCFPASWTLAEKMGKPLPAIHQPVADYDAGIAKRVQRVFDALRPGTILTRSNALIYEKPDLFAPKPEAVHKDSTTGKNFLRTERQTLRRLPQSGAVVFGIHTTVMAVKDMPEADRRALFKADAAKA